MKHATRLTARELETTARVLDQEIHKLERRGWHQTPSEHMRAVELKKLRLRAKDRLSELRSR